MNKFKLTLEEKQVLNGIKKKKDKVAEKYYEFLKKFGRTAGSVFDGGFHTEIMFDKLTKEEYQEYLEIEKAVKELEKYMEYFKI